MLRSCLLLMSWSPVRCGPESDLVFGGEACWCRPALCARATAGAAHPAEFLAQGGRALAGRVVAPASTRRRPATAGVTVTPTGSHLVPSDVRAGDLVTRGDLVVVTAAPGRLLMSSQLVE